MGTKTACDFLGYIVYYLEIWPDLVNLLYVPIDRHIHRILVDKLRIFNEKEVPKQVKNPLRTDLKPSRKLWLKSTHRGMSLISYGLSENISNVKMK